MTPKDIAELDAWSAATKRREAQDDAVCETPGSGKTDSSNKGPLSYSGAFQEFICRGMPNVIRAPAGLSREHPRSSISCSLFGGYND